MNFDSQEAFQPVGSEPQKSWLGRNCIWFVPLILVLLGLPSLCCIGGGLSFFGLFKMMEAPRDAAVEAISADPDLSTALGAPIQPAGSGMSVSNYQNNNGNGFADVDFNVEGSKGSAHVTGRMKLTAGEWSPENLTVQMSDGTEVKLPRED